MTSRKFFVWVVAQMLCVVTLIGCGSDQKSTVTGPESGRIAGSTTQPEGYPPYSFQQNVPWLSQLPPKNPADPDSIAWHKTKNCGQTCVVMARGYINGAAVNSSAIEAADRLLAIPNGSAYDPPYSAVTNTAKLVWLCQQYGLQATASTGQTPADVVNLVASGKVVIVGVKIGMTTTAAGHFMILTGYDGTYLYFHDPGRSQASKGRFVRYSISQFDASWATQGRAYVKVSR
jgi:hypothetical protein